MRTQFKAALILHHAATYEGRNGETAALDLLIRKEAEILYEISARGKLRDYSEWCRKQ